MLNWKFVYIELCENPYKKEKEKKKRKKNCVKIIQRTALFMDSYMSTLQIIGVRTLQVQGKYNGLKAHWACILKPILNSFWVKQDRLEFRD